MPFLFLHFHLAKPQLDEYNSTALFCLHLNKYSKRRKQEGRWWHCKFIIRKIKVILRTINNLSISFVPFSLLFSTVSISKLLHFPRCRTPSLISPIVLVYFLYSTSQSRETISYILEFYLAPSKKPTHLFIGVLIPF